MEPNETGKHDFMKPLWYSSWQNFDWVTMQNKTAVHSADAIPLEQL